MTKTSWISKLLSSIMVACGQMIILPVGKTVVYIEPVHLQTTQLNSPELQGMITGRGQIVLMAKSLEEAYDKLAQIEKNKRERRPHGESVGACG